MYATRHPRWRRGLSAEMEEFLSIAHSKIDDLHSNVRISGYTRSFAKIAFERLCHVNKDIPTAATLDAFIGACVTTAGTCFGNQPTIEEVANMMSIQKSQIKEALGLLGEYGVSTSFRRGANGVVRTTLDYCRVFGTRLEFADMATELAASIYESKCLDTIPSVMACCAVLMVGHILGDIVSLPRIADYAGHKQVTIRCMYRRLRFARKCVLNPEWEDPWEGLNALHILGREIDLGFYDFYDRSGL